MRRRRSEQRENLVAHLRRGAFIRIEAEDPVMAAMGERLIAQIAEAAKLDLHHARTQRLRDLGRRSLLPESTTTTSSAHSTLETASAIFSASLWARI